MMRLRLEMLQPLSITLFWKAQMSSEVAVSGERLRNAANRLQLSMWLLCVCSPRLRAIMSSIMRWRSGLMAAGVLFFEERIVLLLSTGEPRRTQDGLRSPRPSSFVDQSVAVAQDAPALSGLARSAFVPWHTPSLRPPSSTRPLMKEEETYDRGLASHQLGP